MLSVFVLCHLFCSNIITLKSWWCKTTDTVTWLLATSCPQSLIFSSQLVLRFSSSVWQRNIRMSQTVYWGTWSYMFKAIIKFVLPIIWTKWPEKQRCDYVFSLTLTLTIEVCASTEVHASTLCFLQASHWFQNHICTDAYWQTVDTVLLNILSSFCLTFIQLRLKPGLLTRKETFFNYFAHSRPFLWGGHPLFPSRSSLLK